MSSHGSRSGATKRKNRNKELFKDLVKIPEPVMLELNPEQKRQLQEQEQER